MVQSWLQPLRKTLHPLQLILIFLYMFTSDIYIRMIVCLCSEVKLKEVVNNFNL